MIKGHLSLILTLFLFLFNIEAGQAEPAPSPQAEVPHGGALLEYPRGRFQENAPPDFFKWSLLRPAHSVSIKIYRTDESGHYSADTDLITRYDLLSKIQSATWTRDSFPKGSYAWTIELYDDSNPEPVYIDTAKFIVEELKHYDLKTFRMGAVVGFSRGSYFSQDPTYELQYDTTPTTYGLSFAGGHNQSTWNITGYISDFILQGKVQRNLNLLTGYYSRMNGINKFGTEIYAGPSLRTFQFPRARTADGTTIKNHAVLVVNPGASVVLQKRFDLHVTLYSQLSADLPVLGSDKVKMGFDQLNYTVHGGMIYGLFWPIGFSGELQYRVDKAATYDGPDLVTTRLEEWGVVANLLYAF